MAFARLQDRLLSVDDDGLIVCWDTRTKRVQVSFYFFEDC